MTVALVPLKVNSNADALAAQVALGFGGDQEPPKELLAQTERMHARSPRPDPWGSYIAYLNGTPVGFGAFKTAPDGQGAVEIAYMTFPAFCGPFTLPRTFNPRGTG